MHPIGMQPIAPSTRTAYLSLWFQTDLSDSGLTETTTPDGMTPEMQQVCIALACRWTGTWFRVWGLEHPFKLVYNMYVFIELVEREPTSKRVLVGNRRIRGVLSFDWPLLRLHAPATA